LENRNPALTEFLIFSTLASQASLIEKMPRVPGTLLLVFYLRIWVMHRCVGGEVPLMPQVRHWKDDPKPSAN